MFNPGNKPGLASPSPGNGSERGGRSKPGLRKGGIKSKALRRRRYSHDKPISSCSGRKRRSSKKREKWRNYDYFLLTSRVDTVLIKRSSPSSSSSNSVGLPSPKGGGSLSVAIFPPPSSSLTDTLLRGARFPAAAASQMTNINHTPLSPLTWRPLWPDARDPPSLHELGRGGAIGNGEGGAGGRGVDRWAEGRTPGR